MALEPACVPTFVSVLPGNRVTHPALDGCLGGEYLEPVPSVTFARRDGLLTISTEGIGAAFMRLADEEVDWLRSALKRSLDALPREGGRRTADTEPLPRPDGDVLAVRASASEITGRRTAPALDGCAAAVVVTEGSASATILLGLSDDGVTIHVHHRRIPALLAVLSPIRQRLSLPVGTIVYPDECGFVTPVGDYWRLDVDGFYLELGVDGSFVPPRRYDSGRPTHLAWRIRTGGNPHAMGPSPSAVRYSVSEAVTVVLPGGSSLQSNDSLGHRIDNAAILGWMRDLCDECTTNGVFAKPLP